LPCTHEREARASARGASIHYTRSHYRRSHYRRLNAVTRVYPYACLRLRLRPTARHPGKSKSKPRHETKPTTSVSPQPAHTHTYTYTYTHERERERERGGERERERETQHTGRGRQAGWSIRGPGLKGRAFRLLLSVGFRWRGMGMGRVDIGEGLQLDVAPGLSPSLLLYASLQLLCACAPYARHPLRQLLAARRLAWHFGGAACKLREQVPREELWERSGGLGVGGRGGEGGQRQCQKGRPNRVSAAGPPSLS